VQRFAGDYAPVALYRLPRSYRCSDRILRAAAGIMGKGEGDALAGLQPGVSVRIACLESDRAEAEFVARAIESLMGGVRFFSLDSEVGDGTAAAGVGGFGDFAVLCRASAQFPLLREALANHGIACEEAEDEPFFERRPARDLLDLLRGAERNADDFSARLAAAAEKGLPGARTRLRETGAGAGAPVARLISMLRREYFPEVAGAERRDLERLEEAAADCGAEIGLFLQQLAVGRGQDALKAKLEGVALLTLHAAKGLEFPCVFVVGCEEGLLPYALFPESAGDPEEERRLLYVGITRAGRHLFLTHVRKRRLFGREWKLERSSFLLPVERELLAAGLPERRREPLQRKLFDL
jgi:superfamily I DNA/RNA helicase